MNKTNKINNYFKDNELDLDKIIVTYTPYIKTVINNMANNNLSNEDKEEILSDTFFVLWKNQNNKIESLESYIAGIARNLVRVKFRKKNITYNLSDYENNIVYYDSELLLEQENDMEKIRILFKKMKPIDIKIINMFYYSSKSTKDIAEELNISEINVRTRLFRIRKKIKKEFNKGG